MTKILGKFCIIEKGRTCIVEYCMTVVKYFLLELQTALEECDNVMYTKTTICQI
jgi:hypothetical protein